MSGGGGGGGKELREGRESEGMGREIEWVVMLPFVVFWCGRD